MVLAEIASLIFAIAAVIGGILLLAKLSKTRKIGIWWLSPFTFLLGWWVDFQIGSSNSVFKTIFNVILWAFIFTMVIVNIKVLIYGSRSGFKRTINMWTEFKSSAKDVHNGAFVGWFKRKQNNNVDQPDESQEIAADDEFEEQEEAGEDNEI